MATNESVNMDGVWLVYYAFPHEGVEGNTILTIKGDIPKVDVIDLIRSYIFDNSDAEVKERCEAHTNMLIKGLTRIGDVAGQ